MRLFAEYQDGCPDARIWLEGSGGQRYDALHYVIRQQFAAQADVGIRVGEEHTLGNDDGAPTSDIQQIEHQPAEQQLALVGNYLFLAFALRRRTREQVDVLFQVDAVDSAGKRRIGQYEMI